MMREVKRDMDPLEFGILDSGIPDPAPLISSKY
jgi:hypothetical protein